MSPAPAAADVKSVLVINVARIGDTVLATPAIRALARAYPNARITVLAHPNRAEVFEHLPFIAQLGSITKHRARWMGRMGGPRYDLAVVFGFDEPLVDYAVRAAGRVIAFRQADERLNARLAPAVAPPPFQSKHSVSMHLALTDALCIPHAGLRLAYRVSDDEARWARTTLAVRTPTAARPLIGLQIASFPTKGYRDWPVAHFGDLAERIANAHPNAHFLIFGGTLERDRTQALHQRFARQSTHLAGTLSLRQTAALMNCLDLYVGVDTGPTHIAGALEVPMVVLYHAYSPSRLLAPFDHPAFVAIDHPQVGADTEAAMAAITVDSVWTQVAAVLARTIDRAPRAAEPSLA